jgi:hypothetical protein
LVALDRHLPSTADLRVIIEEWLRIIPLQLIANLLERWITDALTSLRWAAFGPLSRPPDINSVHLERHLTIVLVGARSPLTLSRLGADSIIKARKYPWRGREERIYRISDIATNSSRDVTCDDNAVRV